MSDIADMNLSIADQKQLETLVAEAERNRSDAQRLALDASKLLSVTSSRLAEYKDRGFFKRCWYKISGKQGELDRANQADLIAMQKFAYAYLTKLQEQNLLEAKAIAVIRSNLKDLQDEVGEIHDMINVIVRKFDARITKLENVTALQDWQIHINANEQQFRKDNRAICFIQLVFDYLDVMRKNNIPFDAIEGRPDLKLALKTFGIDVSATRSIGDFVQEVFEGAEKFGFKNLKELVALRLEGEEISPTYILDNVTGAGFNALYAFVMEMDKMSSLAKNLSGSEENKAAMLKTILGAVNYAGTEYTPIELGMEILGGSLLAEEIYAQENGITIGGSSQLAESEQFDIGDLFSDYMTISSHPFLATNPSDADKKIYLEFLALVYATVGYNDGSVYLKALSSLFGQEESMNRIEWLSRYPAQIKPMIPEMIKMLSSDSRKFAWCVDAIYLGLEKGGKEMTDKLKNGIAQICKFLKIKDDVTKRLLDGAEKLATAQLAKEYVDAISSLHDLTDNWKTILEVRGASLKGAFTAQREALAALVRDAESGDLTNAELFTSNLSEKAKSNCDALDSKIRALMSQVRSILSMFNTDASGYDKILLCGIPQQKNSAAMCLTKKVRALKALSTQLEMYENGNFTENAMALDEGQNGMAQEVAISENGTSRKLSVELKKLEHAPFDHSNIKAIEFFDGNWYAMIDEKGIWRSADGENWQNSGLPSGFSLWHANMCTAGDALIAWNGTEMLVRKADRNEWFKVNAPVSGWSKNIAFIYKVKDEWIIQTSERTEYTYTSKGVIWDSKETSSYNAAAFYKCADLAENANWTRIGGFDTKDGIGIQPGCVCFVDDGAVALADKDALYCRLKESRRNAGSCFIYALKGNGWKNADCQADAFSHVEQSYIIKGSLLGLAGSSSAVSSNTTAYGGVNARIMNYNNRLLCSCTAGILSSTDGRVWELLEKWAINASNCGDNVSINMLSDIIIASVAYDNRLACSLDGKTFISISIEPFPSLIAYGRDSILIVDTHDNTGGIFLGKVK